MYAGHLGRMEPEGTLFNTDLAPGCLPTLDTHVPLPCSSLEPVRKGETGQATSDPEVIEVRKL